MAYVKKTWVNGEILDADKMNHLEDGVEAVYTTEWVQATNIDDGAVTSAKINASVSITNAQIDALYE